MTTKTVKVHNYNEEVAPQMIDLEGIPPLERSNEGEDLPSPSEREVASNKQSGKTI
jgi:hypothetical protein